MILHPRLYLGTSSWSSKDWEGVFYPAGMPPADYLSFYATRYRTVEVDATFYRTPSVSMTKKWRATLPEGFVLAAKVHQVITHEKLLLDVQQDVDEFLEAMSHLGDRLGPLLFQFPYFSKASGMDRAEFVARLKRFLPTLPAGHRYAVEVRNKGWLVPALLETLKEHGVALTLIDHPWMPRIDELLDRMDPVTADFVYVRWLGDRRGIEEKTKTWERVIVDRSREMRLWVPAIRALLNRGATVYGYINNHYAGHAPGSIELFERAWESEPVTPDPAP